MTSSSTDKYAKPICKNGRYDNPFSTWVQPTFYNLCKYVFQSPDHTNIPSKEVLDVTLPIDTPDLSLFSAPPKQGMRVLWVGHATTLVQFDGITILTDPMFSDRCSISQLAGPRRYRDIPCRIEDLPHVDVILISHNHYDHLDYNSVLALQKKYGSKLNWFVPSGNKKWMDDNGCTNVKELTWWEESEVPNHPQIRVVCTPCQHWSKRTLLDTNEALWSSWCVLGPSQKYFFAGDTGYCDAFKQIGKHYGPFTVSAIPIGAYEPRWFMGPQHVDPGEAIQVHLDIMSQQSFGIHWGTFKLTKEHYLEPPQKLREELQKKNMPQSDFLALRHGEIVLFES